MDEHPGTAGLPPGADQHDHRPELRSGLIRPLGRRPIRQWYLHGLSGRLLLQPWYDSAALPLVTNLYFRLSRGWAAVLDGERAHVSPRTVRRLLANQERYRTAEREWHQALFGEDDPGQSACAQAEASRRLTAQRHMAQRNWLLPSARHWPQVRLEPASAADVEAAHGQRLADWAHAYPAPEPVRVHISRRIPHWHGRQYWLRHASPFAGDDAWARVIEPAESKPRATLIYLHGVGMEPEMWPELDDPIIRLTQQGLRVVLPEGPWHGRRRPDGWFGGEPVLGRVPLGLFEFFRAWVDEIARLIGWSREQGVGPVAIGGVSLGSQCSQLVATAATHWPRRLQPDAMLLVATSTSAAYDGELIRAVGLTRWLRRTGWSDAVRQHWMRRLEPGGLPVMPPDKIVFVLGSADTITPFQEGRALAEMWDIPQQNLFIRRRGHFSLSIGLVSDQPPLQRFVQALA